LKSLEIAEPFYDKFSPILGFNISLKSKGKVAHHEFEVIEYYHPRLTFGINLPLTQFKIDNIYRRRPGSLHHLAVKAKSRDEVDRVFLLIKQVESNIIERPNFFLLLGLSYYATFFKTWKELSMKYLFRKEPTAFRKYITVRQYLK
jgi:hypothetical protein